MDTKYLFLKDNTWVFRIRIPKEFQFYYENNKEYSKVQQQNYELIKALHESGLGYRRIANHLNAKEIKTKKGNLWKHNNVYSVVKKYKEKQKRIILRNKKYKIVIGKIKLEWLKIKNYNNKENMIKYLNYIRSKNEKFNKLYGTIISSKLCNYNK